MAMRGSWTLFLLAPLFFVAEGTARADDAPSFGPGLRPYLHTNRFGETLVDVCPERALGARRCFSQRIVRPDSPRPVVPTSGGICSPMGGGGYGSPPAGTLGPSQINARYKLPSSAVANGAIVALVELPSTHALNDVNTYRSAFGIPPLSECPVDSKGVPNPGGTACFARVGKDGTVNTVTSVDCAGWSGETGLDMDMVSAACPDCSIVLVEAPTDPDLDSMNQVAATVVHAAAISNSWGSPEYSGADQSPYTSPTSLIFAASGDSGYLNEDQGANAANFPASSPHVIAVGGTTVEALGGGVYTEVVWNDDGMGGGGAGGSGCSQLFPMPTYQTGSGFSFGSCSLRASVDISAAAEYYPTGGGGGIAAYAFDDGGWTPVVGTSAASPLVAAIMVRVGLAGKDNHALFYSNIGAFQDVTKGNNDSMGLCGTGIMCNAAAGYDGPTGLGSPDATALFALAGGVSPPPPDAGPPVDSGGPPDAGGVDSGGPPPADGSAPPPPGSIGTHCTGPSMCTAPNQCVSSGSGKSPVCAPACDMTTPCPSGYDCTGGFCFAGPPKTGNGKSHSPSGCACSTVAASSPWGAAVWLGLGLLGFTRRRRAR